MKFKTTIKELKKAINFLYPIINYNHVSLPYRYLLMKFKDGKIELKAFDDYTIGSSFVKIYDVEEDENNSGYVLAKHFISLINSFVGNEAIVKISDNKINIRVNKSYYSLKTLEDSIVEEVLCEIDVDFLDIPMFDINLKDFVSSYCSVSHCLSKDVSQRNLQNILIKNSKMIACDGIRGALCSFDINNDIEIMLHKKVCDCISNISDSNVVKIGIHEGRLYGKTDNFIFISSLSEEYPYESIQPIIDSFGHKDNVVKIKFDPDEVLDKISRLLIFADNDTNSIAVSIKDNSLNFVVEDADVASETVELFESNVESDFLIFIDGKNFKEALGKSLASVSWEASDSDSVQYLYDGHLLQFFKGLTS